MVAAFLTLLWLFSFAEPRACKSEDFFQYSVPPLKDTLIAVHYYPWFRKGPAECAENPEAESKEWCNCIYQLKHVQPKLGFYGSDEMRIVSAQLDQMMNYGIDIASVEWTGKANEVENILKTFVPALANHNRQNRDDLKFVILYDLAVRLRKNEKIDFDDRSIRKRFLNDFTKFASDDRYFKDPNYLVFENRPVVYLYVTRGIRGSEKNVKSGFDSIRSIARKHGFSGLHLIADHLYWGKVDYEKLRQIGPSAVTSFAPVDGTRGVREQTSVEYRPIRVWADKLADLYLEAKDKLQEMNIDADIQPGIFAQYDDREKETVACAPASKRKAKSYHLMDETDWAYMIRIAGIERRFLAERVHIRPDCSQTVKTNFGGKTILWIYSFNEWTEGTGIEETMPGEPSYPYGFGAKLLETLKQQFQ